MDGVGAVNEASLNWRLVRLVLLGEGAAGGGIPGLTCERFGAHLLLEGLLFGERSMGIHEIRVVRVFLVICSWCFFFGWFCEAIKEGTHPVPR